MVSYRACENEDSCSNSLLLGGTLGMHLGNLLTSACVSVVDFFHRKPNQTRKL